MAAIRSRDTSPELTIRREVHRRGFRYRLHCATLPGRPDLVFPKYHLAVFVHGCFWHGHVCHIARRPKTNLDYWNPKIEKNIRRDRQSAKRLRQSGWRVVTIRECRLSQGRARLIRLLEKLNV